MTHYLIQCDASDVKLDAWRELQIFESFRVKPDEPRSTGEDGQHSAVGGTVLMICQTCGCYKKVNLFTTRNIYSTKEWHKVWCGFPTVETIYCLNNLIVEGARCFFWIMWEDERRWFESQETLIGLRFLLAARIMDDFGFESRFSWTVLFRFYCRYGFKSRLE